MGNKVYNLAVLALALFVVPIAAEAQPESVQSREYQIKAAFLYNFIRFVDWPEEKTADSNEPIIIGIIGECLFGDVFEPIKGKKVEDRKIVVRWFKSFEELKKSGKKSKPSLNREIEALRKCHLLFICSSEKKKEIVEALKGSYVLTVGETAGFLEVGGIINFIVEEKKIRFEINVAAAGKAGLKVRSKLLRLAKRVVREKPSKRTKG